MKRLVLFVLSTFIVLGLAQTASAQDIDNWEFYIGYSHARIETGLPDDDFDPDDDPFDPDFDLDDIIDERSGFNGFEIAATGNFSEYAGVRIDFSGNYNSQDAIFDPAIGPAEFEQSLYQLLIGLQIKNNADDDDPRLRPFGYGLVGVAAARQQFDAEDDLFDDFINDFEGDFDDTGFALEVGGGLDWRLGDNFSIRFPQVSYNPTWLFDDTLHNFRIGAGLVFH